MNVEEIIGQARLTADVTVRIEGDRLAAFACPHCHARVLLKVAYPFEWKQRTCWKCGTVWVVPEPTGDMTRAEDTSVGVSRVLTFYSVGRLRYRGKAR